MTIRIDEPGSQGKPPKPEKGYTHPCHTQITLFETLTTSSTYISTWMMQKYHRYKKSMHFKTLQVWDRGANKIFRCLYCLAKWLEDFECLMLDVTNDEWLSASMPSLPSWTSSFNLVSVAVDNNTYWMLKRNPTDHCRARSRLESLHLFDVIFFEHIAPTP